ncbi:MAG TPA: glycoside hydrolase family 25 protein [Bacteroidales bacterium]|nr:glycoside hydrolase family 25 protein [Bacteroidales bacterium]
MARRRSRKKKNKSRKWLYIFLITAIIFYASYYYRFEIYGLYKFYFSSDKLVDLKKEKQKTNSIFEKYSIFGLDVSQYQKKINWSKVAEEENLKFVFIRATAGKDFVDKKFNYNWKESKKNKIIRGAYHYYRPNENSRLQAQNFIKTVNLEPGDLPPVLDIERFSSVQSLTSLKNGVLKWLKIVEEHYGVKPILYTYQNFYISVFRGDKRFETYPLWIAYYSTKSKPDKKVGDWIFWQFSESGRVEGISENVDLNVFYSDYETLKSLTIK